MTDLVFRNATPADRDAAVALLAAAHGSDVRDAATWEWLYGGHLGRYVVADAGDRLAAQYALLPLRVHHRGRTIDASLSLDTATHPDFAGRGLMTELGLLAYGRSGADLVIGFPNPKSAWVLYNRLEWTELTPFPLLFKPLRRLFREMLPTHRQRNAPQIERGSVERFGAWADEIWAATAPHVGTGVVRDSAYLNWRFVESPNPYALFAEPSGGEPAAYAVLRTVPWRGGTISYLMEFAARPGAVREARRALAVAIAAATAARSSGVAAVVTPRNPLRDVLRRAGFLRPPARARSGFSFGARLSGALAAHDELRELGGWHVTAGDFDHI